MKIVSTRQIEEKPWFLETRTRLFLSLFAALAVPALIFSGFVATFARHQLLHQATQENRLVTQVIGKQLDEQFFGLRRYTQSFATRSRLISGLRDNDLSTVTNQVADFVEQNIRVSRALLTDPNGILLYDYPPVPGLIGKDFSHFSWFSGTTAPDRPSVSEIFERATDDKATVVAITARVHTTNGQDLAYLTGQVTTEELRGWLAAISPTASERVFLFDNRGTLLKSESSEREQFAKLPEIQAMLHQEEGSEMLKSPVDGRKYLVTHAEIPSIGWTVILIQPTSEILLPLKTFARIAPLFLAISLGIVGLIGWYWYKLLAKYTEGLRRSNLELQGFCYSIAHNLRSPLRAMRGFCTALAEDCSKQLDAQGKDYASRVGGAALKMDKLIQDLLNYGDTAHRELNLQAIDLDQKLDEILEPMKERIVRKNAKLEIKHPLPVVYADAHILQRVLRELTSNALKFVDDGEQPHVIFSAHERGGYVRITVEDEGIGINPVFSERIFGMFERLHFDDAYTGTGIGLAVVRKGVERMGGRAGVESRPGKGSLFWIDLPKA